MEEKEEKNTKDIFEDIGRDLFENRFKKTKKNIGKEMCSITKKKVAPYESYEDIIILKDSEDEDEYEKVLHDMSDIEELLGEIGCPICEKNDEIFLGKCEEPCVGAGCRINYGSCQQEGGTLIGSFHTHPIDGNVPSLNDMEEGLKMKDKISCIGGKIANQDEILCYDAKSLIKRTFLPYSPFSGYYPKPSEEAHGIIKFYRETPPPLPSELLEDFSDEMIEDYVKIHAWSDEPEQTPEELKEAVKEFKETLRGGEIPEEWWEGYEPESYLDELPIYTLEQQEKINEFYKEHLKNHFYTASFRCNEL